MAKIANWSLFLAACLFFLTNYNDAMNTYFNSSTESRESQNLQQDSNNILSGLQTVLDCTSNPHGNLLSQLSI